MTEKDIYPPHPDDGLSYRFDHNIDEWVDPIDPQTGLTPEETLAREFESENLHGFHTPRGDWPDRPQGDY